ncbi:HET-domain-containing protein [Mycena venus]|uniref:HET-domain-containing protein n=1 Tax=Mycena venus TaxID=2733690 RepID=A0A8H6YRH6_9AGAR|nr:HET-domain-containing protein [Mycena venus]
MEKANTTLEVTVDILELLSGTTENVPYLSIITDYIKRLIEIHKAVSDNETRASEVLNNIFNVSHVLAKGLCDLHDQNSTAASGLKNVLEKYQTFLNETCHIFEKWIAESRDQSFAHGNFLGILEGIDLRLNAFRDAFGVRLMLLGVDFYSILMPIKPSRVRDLSTGEDALNANPPPAELSGHHTTIYGGIGGPGGHGDVVGGAGGKGDGPHVPIFCPEISNMTVHGDVINHSASGTREKLEKWLSPAKVGISQHDAAQKRHSNTGLWLFERMEFMEWIYARNSLLWLEGISGSGKTVLRYFRLLLYFDGGLSIPRHSSTIIATLRARAEPLAYFYFDTNNSEQRTVTQLLRSLVWQISAQGPSPDTILDKLWRCSYGQDLPTDTVLISDALIPILKEFTEPVYIVLDALDECSERDRLLTTIITILDADLPNLHLLLTSRPEVPRTSTNLPKHAVLLSLQDFTRQDIKSYLTMQLSDLEFGWSVERQGDIKNRLLDRGSGMFRLVSLQLDELRHCDGSEHQINEALATMPSSLDKIYDHIIKNIKNPAMVSAVLRAMNWLIFSKDPLTVKKIIDALAFDFEQEPLRFSKVRRMQPKPFLQACAGLVTVSQKRWNNGQIKLAHASVKEYFLSQKAPREAFGDHQHISEQTAHHLLARTCISYLCSIDHVLEEDTYRQQYPLTDYALSYWSFHLKLCDEIRLAQYGGPPVRRKPHTLDLFSLVRSSRAQSSVVPKTGDLNRKTPRLVDVVLELFQADSKPYLNLCHLEPEHHWTVWNKEFILPPLHRAIFLGVGPLVCRLLEHSAEVNTKDDTALAAAIKSGHIEIARLLLEHGAAVNAQGGSRPLQAASSKGDVEIARLLLEHGAKVNAKGGHYGTALQAAASNGHIEMARLLLEHGHIDMARLLLEHGAKVNMKDGEYGNALQAAFISRNVEMVRLLLEHGAKVDGKGGDYDTALEAAASNGHIEMARLLLEHDAKVNRKGREYSNALQTAFISRNVEMARLLLEHGAKVNAKGGDYGTALEAAASNGHIEMARLLLEHDAKVNGKGGEYGNALQAAASNGHIEIARLLLEHDAKVKGKGEDYGTALAAAIKSGHIEIARLLLEHGTAVNAQGGSRPLQVASSKGDVEIARLLLEHGAEVNSQGGHYGTALQAAASNGHIEIVRLLLEHGAEVNSQGGHYGTALQAAASNGHIEIVRLLLEHGAEVNAQGEDYDTALLQAAVWDRRVDIVRLLLEHGAEVNVQGGPCSYACIRTVQWLLRDGKEVKVQGGPYDTALEAAASNGHIEIVRLLLEHGAEVNGQGGDYDTALQVAASNGRLETVCLLLEHGAEVNAKGGDYDTALQAASSRGHVEIVRLLFEHGADVNSQGGDYGTALQAAASNDHIEIVRLLLEHGAERCPRGGNVEIARLLLEHDAEVNVQGRPYGTALTAAALNGHIEMARLLLEHGADVNAQSRDNGTTLHKYWHLELGVLGRNALHAASSRGHVEIVRLLLEHGAEVNVQGEDYDTALQAAASNHHIEIVRLLLEHGAEVNAQGGYYDTALQVAVWSRDIEMARLLLKHGAEVNTQGGRYGIALRAFIKGDVEMACLLVWCHLSP